MKTLLTLLASTCLISNLMAAAQTTAPVNPALPADAEHAKEAIQKSPRHGEWVDIALPGSETQLHIWVVYPERKDKAPVVVVIHEIFGLTDWVRGVADQLAAEGFIAIAPDLLSGMGPDGGGTDSLGDKATDTIRKLSSEETSKRLDAAREYALALPSASGKSGCVGFCWGGSASFAYAAHQPKLNGAVVYYGTAPKEEAALKKIECPVLGLFGSDDARVNSTLDATTKSMSELKKDFSPNIYDKAGHGFLRQQTGREGANLKAAEQAWNATIEFFRKNLQ